jgi:membrane-associated protein
MDIVELFHQIKSYLDPRTIVAAGYFVLLFAVFAETGLAAGFFLPGDSLLVVAGLFAAKGDLSVWILLGALWVAAVAGDAVGYYSGYKLGPKLFTKQESLVFKPSHIQKATHFYNKYGGKTIIIARFVPVVRTFAPIVAGAAQMPYRQFVIFNLAGGFAWVFSMILTGYFLGSVIPDLDKHIEWVVIIVVGLSLLPPIFEFWKSRSEKSKSDRVA